MQQNAFFHVYNASAGSGKTFTLVKEYLKIILTSEDIFRFQKILAITFTNKAAGEMKERVLKNLHDFSEGKENDLFLTIINEIAVDKPTIKERSKKNLDAILQNYSAFSITTIDSFTHKIIRNFAYDLGLSLNFEVEMDAISLLNEAVDVLISKIGTNKALTQLLIDFSLAKTDDDKSWDISRELNDFSKILLNENDIKHFKKLATKSIDDFKILKNKLSKHQQGIQKQLQETGNKGVNIIKDAGLEVDDFFKKPSFSRHFLNLSLGNKVGFFKENTLKKYIKENKFYTKSAPKHIKATIETVLPKLLPLYQQSEVLYQQQLLIKTSLKSIIPLAVLNHINSELTTIKEANNIRLNAEFNQLISENIKEQPAPFIYERIGQKFMHYFIDEMQDTSELQWQNLIPLIDNALAQENSNLLLVGDGKQAIYRWRGGKASQFIDLGSKDNTTTNLFPIQKKVKELATNYRSYTEIINFNNSFFTYCANFLQNNTYKKLFTDGNQQKTTDKKGGFVSISFLEKEEEKEEEQLKYPKKVKEIIQNLDTGFSLSDVCVLVRKKKEGVAVANYLSEKGIPIISSETLLLQNSDKVNFIINLLQVVQHPEDKNTLFKVLYFLYSHLQVTEDKHTFIDRFVSQNLQKIATELTTYGVTFQLKTFYRLPFYEKIEEIIRSFSLLKTSDAYVQFFLDEVLHQQRKGTSIQEFLDFWELKKETLSIVASENVNAVQVMTIHKSKGLEFPIVIFPYDLDIYRQISPKVWLDELPTSIFDDFSELLIDYSKSISYINERAANIYQQEEEELELDTFNLLYVTLTRAVEQLYIVTEKKINKNGEINPKYSSGIFIKYLQEKGLWNESKLTYHFGNPKKESKPKNKKSLVTFQKEFISTPWQDHQIYLLASASKLWDTKQETAIAYGNLIHEMMSKIILKTDVENIVHQYKQQGFIEESNLLSIKHIINQIVFHPQLEEYFSNKVTVFTERELFTQEQEIIIPDRLVFNKHQEVTIIDYKTGTASKKHQLQILNYKATLESMNFKVTKLLLIYIGKEITVVKV